MLLPPRLLLKKKTRLNFVEYRTSITIPRVCSNLVDMRSWISIHLYLFSHIHIRAQVSKGDNRPYSLQLLQNCSM